MRDIRTIRVEKTAAGEPAFEAQPDASQNLLPEQSHLPVYYQALKQKGQVPEEGMLAILRDLNDRVEKLEQDENKETGPAPGQNESDTQE